MITLTDRYLDALSMAFHFHAKQRRKCTGTPFLGHPLRVSACLMDWAESEDEVIAALLHDTAEDCGGQKVIDAIRERFGDLVAGWVADCSDSLAEDPTKKADWTERKLADIARASTVDVAVRRIRLCDKIDNARSLLDTYQMFGEKTFEKFTAGKRILWYFRQMYEALKDGTPKALADELLRVVVELEKKVDCE